MSVELKDRKTIQRYRLTQDFVSKKLREIETFKDKGKGSIPAGEYRDESLKGFILDIGNTGTLSYRVNARVKHGAKRTISIGQHPAFTSTQAREKAEDLIRTMRAGIDPVDLQKEIQKEKQEFAQKETLEQLRRSLTLKRVFDEWYVEASTKQTTKDLYRQVIHKHLKLWLSVPLSEITRDMVIEKYDQVKKETISSANNTFRGLRLLYTWINAKYEDDDRPDELVLERKPVLVLSKRKKWKDLEARNDKYIADMDLPAWFAAVNQLKNQTYRDYFVLLFVTGLRKGEAAGLLRADVDFKRNRFTVRDTKNKTDHTLPMTPFVRSMLERRCVDKENDSQLVFPGQRGLITDFRHHQDLVVEICKVEWTPHALRRTFSYAAERARLGEIEHKKLLNHLQKGNITTSNYSPRDIDNLLEPLLLVETFLLERASSPFKVPT